MSRISEHPDYFAGNGGACSICGAMIKFGGHWMGATGHDTNLCTKCVGSRAIGSLVADCIVDTSMPGMVYTRLSAALRQLEESAWRAACLGLDSENHAKVIETETMFDLFKDRGVK